VQARGGHGSTMGTAQTTLDMTGVSGAYTALSDTGFRDSGHLLTYGFSQVSGEVDGAGTAMTRAAFGGGIVSHSSTGEGVALPALAPNNSDTTAVLNPNANLAAAFGNSATWFSLSEVGGGFTTGGTQSQVVSTHTDFSVDLSQLATRNDLTLGMFNTVSI